MKDAIEVAVLNAAVFPERRGGCRINLAGC